VCESGSGSSSFEGGASDSVEDDEEDDASEQEDEQAKTGAPPIPAEDGPPFFCSEDCPEPIPVDNDEYIDGEVYAAAAESFADEMHNAAAPEAPKIYIPPPSLYV
jgi:2-keto-4-pentenoate hydratase/2-oxohepta-3-ene-1,7-dioic acid hydratase in catechol pathway